MVALAVADDLWSLILLAPFLGVLLALTVIDYRWFRLPDQIVFPSLICAALLIAIGDGAGGRLRLITAVAGAVLYGAILGLVYIGAQIAYRGREAMGRGDVKLAVLIGLVLGAIDLGSVAVAIGSTILLGGLVGVVSLALGSSLKTKIPYGPLMAFGALVASVAGSRLFDAYIGLYQ